MHRWSLMLIAGVAFVGGCTSGAAGALTSMPPPPPVVPRTPVASELRSDGTAPPIVLRADGIAPPIALTGNACVDWPALHARSTVAITGTSDQLRRSMPVFLDDIARFRQSVPAAQRADVEVFADVWSAIGRELQRIDYDLVRLALDPTTRTVVQEVGTPAAVDAMKHLDAWSKTSCPPAR